MDFSKIYYLGGDFKRGEFWAHTNSVIKDPWALLRNEIKVREPIKFYQLSGSKLYDLIKVSDGASILLSDKVINLLKENKFTGWTTYPMKLFGKDGRKDGKEIRGYHGFAVTGKCGPFDNSKSIKVLRPPRVPEAEPYEAWMGLFFDPKSWDGSDIFVPANTGAIFLIEKVKEALEKAKVKNIRFKKISEMENYGMKK